MRRINNLLAIGAFSLLTLGLPAIASAQYGQYDPYGRNGQNDPYGNGRYGTYGNNGNTRSVVRDLKHRAKDFQRQLDRDLDNSRYNGSSREDQMNELAQEFRNAVNRLNSGNGNQDSGRVQRVLDLGRDIDRSISRSGVGYNAQNIWSGIRYDLDALGRAYGYNGNYRNNRNRNYPNNYPNSYPNNYPNTGRNVPSWWPF